MPSGEQNGGFSNSILNPFKTANHSLSSSAGYQMLSQLLAIILLVAANPTSDGDRDLAELLASIGSLTAERWDLSFDAETNTVSLHSKQPVAAMVTNYSFGPKEQMYRIVFRFQIVPPVDEKDLERHVGQVQRELAELRDAARTVPQEEVKGHVTYFPQTASQWQAVLKVRRAELRVREIPQYVFKNIYLVPTYEMTFRPRPGDAQAEASAQDIKRVYAMFRPLARPAPYRPKTE